MRPRAEIRGQRPRSPADQRLAVTNPEGLWRQQGEPKRSDRASRNGAIHQRSSPAMQLGSFAHEAQAEAGALAPGGRILQRVKALEHAAEREVGNPRPFVLDRDPRLTLSGADLHRDGPTHGRKVERVL